MCVKELVSIVMYIDIIVGAEKEEYVLRGADEMLEVNRGECRRRQRCTTANACIDVYMHTIAVAEGEVHLLLDGEVVLACTLG